MRRKERWIDIKMRLKKMRLPACLPTNNRDVLQRSFLVQQLQTPSSAIIKGLYLLAKSHCLPDDDKGDIVWGRECPSYKSGSYHKSLPLSFCIEHTMNYNGLHSGTWFACKNNVPQSLEMHMWSYLAHRMKSLPQTVTIKLKSTPYSVSGTL